MGVDVLVVGNGGREHALAWALGRSRRVERIAVAPGNGGTAANFENIAVKATDVDGLVAAARSWDADFVVVGPEVALEAGLVDALQSAGIRAFGPTQAGARIESSKRFAKEIMDAAGVPTARWRAFTDLEAGRRYLAEVGAPVVVKADGLAAGKGVTVARTLDEADKALGDCLERAVFGASGSQVVIEEYLEGREVSLMALVDGQTVVPLPPACDYKPVGEGNTGPNTGGMGCYCSPTWFGQDRVRKAVNEILEPVAKALIDRGVHYRGVLYAGLMVANDCVKVLEFNCRFGDPETQVVLPSIDSDILDLLEAVATGSLAGVRPVGQARSAVSVVLASRGYPGAVETGVEITGLDRIPSDCLVFHAGTRLEGKRLCTDGGRVLNVVGSGSTVVEARSRAYAGIEPIAFAGGHYRRDIALNV